MKKTNKIKIGMIVILFAVKVMLTENSVSANSANISAKGDLVFEDGMQVAFYASDIHYLQQEIEALFNEIK